MVPITSTAPVFHESEVGLILHPSFRGEYPYGSLGNSAAEMIKRDLAAAITEALPAGVIVDFTELEYRWGDAICLLANPLRRPDGSFIPACIVASGETARSLTPLVVPDWLLGVAGVRLVDNVDEARRDLVARGG